VEDDPGVRETTADLLRDEGYAVTTASDGLEGMRYLIDASFDVVLLDMRLPRLDGPAILDGMDAPPPLVIVSAMEYFNETELRHRFGSKVFAYLRKPVAPSHLLTVVAEAARGYPAPN